MPAKKAQEPEEIKAENPEEGLPNPSPKKKAGFHFSRKRSFRI